MKSRVRIPIRPIWGTYFTISRVFPSLRTSYLCGCLTLLFNNNLSLFFRISLICSNPPHGLKTLFGILKRVLPGSGTIRPLLYFGMSVSLSLSHGLTVNFQMEEAVHPAITPLAEVRDSDSKPIIIIKNVYFRFPPFFSFLTITITSRQMSRPSFSRPSIKSKFILICYI